MGEIPDSVLQPASEAMTKAEFAFGDLDYLLLRCSGERRMDWITNPLQPRNEIARACLEHANILEVGDTLLATAIADRASEKQRDREFRKTLLSLWSELAKVPAVEFAPVEPLIEGLKRTRSVLTNEEVMAAAKDSQEIFADVTLQIDRLAIYKGLHDCVHQIVRATPRNLKSVVADWQAPANRERLRDLYVQFSTCHSQAENLVEDLRDKTPIGGHEYSSQHDWIEKIGRNLAAWFEARGEADGLGKVRISTQTIVMLAENCMSPLNRDIVAVGENLPLDRLGEALRRIAEVVRATDREKAQQVETAAGAAASLFTHLRNMVLRHKDFQDADEAFMTLRQDIQAPLGSLFEMAIGEWGPVKGMVQMLNQTSPEAMRRNHLKIQIGNVDDSISKLSVLLTGADKIEQIYIDLAVNELRDNLEDCWAEFFVQFYNFDLDLLRQCEQLLRVRDPISDLVKDSQ